MFNIWILLIYWFSGIGLLSWNGRFEAPKVISFFIAGFVFCLYFLLHKRNEFKKLINKNDIFYFLWIITLFISSVCGVHPLDSILGGSYRHQGLIFFIGLWILGKTLLVIPSNYKNLLKLSFIPVVIFESFLIILQFLLYKGRPLGTLGEPNASAGFLVLCFPFLILGFEKVKEKKILKYLSFLIMIVALILTGSRSAIVAYIPLFTFECLTQFRVLKIKKNILIFISLLTIIIFSFILVFRSGFLLRESSLHENRGLIWRVGVKKIMEKPFLGYGAESGEYVYDLAYKEIEIPLVNIMIDRGHNLLIDIGLWSGFVGLAFFSGWILINAFTIYSSKNWLKLIGFVSVLIYSFFQPLGVTHWLMFILILNY
jgi:O-antigen ligase